MGYLTSEDEAESKLECLAEDEVVYDPEPLADDLYGVGTTSFIRDIRKIIIGEGQLCLRFARTTVTLTLLWGTILMQVYLLYQFKRLIASASVHRIRHLYSEYEQWMYNGETALTVNGFHRGIPGYFDAGRFDDLPEHIAKIQLCSLPLSQPYFCVAALMVWTFTVLTDVRKIYFHADLLLWRTDTIESARDMLQVQEDHTTLLTGLTFPIKALLAILIFLPRLALNLVMLWLGCRWLIATMDFSDLLMNAMALEFILLLKDLIYTAVVPRRNQWETATLMIPHKWKTVASWSSYMGAFTLVLLVALWVCTYMVYLQQVLPEYRWDVHNVCVNFLETTMSELAGDDAAGYTPHSHHVHHR